MNKRIAVILSGCGVFDGSEIYESVLTLLRLDQKGVQCQCFAPDMAQHHVINHMNGEEMRESRNVLIESARLARGNIQRLAECQAADFDGLIIPGGFGAAKNLSDFALAGADMIVQKDVFNTVQAFSEAKKPVGLICIAPAMAGKLFGNGVRCTIGNDSEMADTIRLTGAECVDCSVHDIVVDDVHKLVTTPAYMLANSISEAATGINRLVDKVLEMA